MPVERDDNIAVRDFKKKCPLLRYNFDVARYTNNAVIIKTTVVEVYNQNGERLNGGDVARNAVNEVCYSCQYHDNLESGSSLSSGRCDPEIPFFQSNEEAVIKANIGKTKAKNKSGFVYAIKKLFGATSD